MSSLQRTAHVTGLGLPFANAYGGEGSVFQPVGGGAPGILSGPANGFTIAMGLHIPAMQAAEIWAQREPVSPLGAPPYNPALPNVEFLANCVGNEDPSAGWSVEVDSDNVRMFLSGDGFSLAESIVGLDFIVVASFVGDDMPYGGIGEPLVSGANNGNFEVDEGNPATILLPQQQFFLGGTGIDAIGAIAEFGIGGGAARTGINSFWMTEGVPDIEQLNDFMELSMQAGQVIPQAWAPPRTDANPAPATPADPTGHHWTASDLDLSLGMGATWTDRISGVVLERIGALGNARAYGKGHNYFAWEGG